MQREKILNNPLTWVIGGALISSWLFGVLHTFRAHGMTQAVIALVLPPYGVYMLAEQSISHSDSADVAPRVTVDELIEKNVTACRSSIELKLQAGFSDEQMAVFCRCVWRLVIENFPAGENEYVDEYGKNSPELERLKGNAMSTCVVSAAAAGDSAE